MSRSAVAWERSYVVKSLRATAASVSHPLHSVTLRCETLTDWADQLDAQNARVDAALSRLAATETLLADVANDRDRAEGERDAAAQTCRRLAETQQNLPVPMTRDEREDLREAARLLNFMDSRFFEQAYADYTRNANDIGATLEGPERVFTDRERGLMLMERYRGRADVYMQLGQGTLVTFGTSGNHKGDSV